MGLPKFLGLLKFYGPLALLELQTQKRKIIDLHIYIFFLIIDFALLYENSKRTLTVPLSWTTSLVSQEKRARLVLRNLYQPTSPVQFTKLHLSNFSLRKAISSPTLSRNNTERNLLSRNALFLRSFGLSPSFDYNSANRSSDILRGIRHVEAES